jgi:predicted CXXCH cytochrome family protein
MPKLTSKCLIFLIIISVIPSGFSFSKDKAEEKNCLECHPKFYKQLKGKINHEPFKEKECLECHVYHGFTNRRELKSGIQEVCIQCHDFLEGLEDENVHYPISEEESCIICHQPHSSKLKDMLFKPVEQLCTECHDQPPDNKNSIHEPYKNFMCTKCHTPHGTQNNSLLVLPDGFVCVECHTEKITDYSPTELHAANNNQSCELCHTGHYSDNDYLLSSSEEKFCLKCHTNIKNLIQEKEIHSVLTDNDCLTCHIAHYRKGEKYLTDDDPQLCFSCHPDKQGLENLAFPHPPLEDGCASCHNPHAGVLNDPQIEVCGACHEVEEDTFIESHIVKFEIEQCSNCHDSHGSNSERLIYSNLHPPYEDGDCESCHEEAMNRNDLHDNEICLNCHDEPEPLGAHKPNKMNEKHCVSCHSPHASNRDFLLKMLFKN